MLSVSTNQNLNLMPPLAVKDSFHVKNSDDVKQKINQQTLNDYLAFFTTIQGAYMVDYTYLDSSDLFDNLIKYSDDYYLFNDDVSSIVKHKKQLERYLSEVTDIVEIGPGCDYSLTHKTLNILSYAKNLKRYYAVDNFKKYLSNACNFIKNNTTGLKVIGLEADLMKQNNIKLNNIGNGQKCLLFLGSTLGQFDREQQNHCIKQISYLAESNDLLILTIDTNQDEESLLRAYSNKYSSKLIMGVLNYFAKINHDFAKHISSFEVKCKWNKLLSLVDMYFVAKQDLSFELQPNVKIAIRKGQEFRGLKAYKYPKQEIANLLNENNFNVLDVFNQSDRMQIFVCKRN